MNSKLVRNGFYETEFHEINKLGEGSYAKVFEVQKLNISNQMQRFAIKRIVVKNNNQMDASVKDILLKELENFSVFQGLRNEKVVEYYDLWLENKNDENLTFALIQMELCHKSLHTLMREFKNDNKIYDKQNDELTILGFYVLSELMIQILEGVQYLHQQNPQIIHRDLNLYNILLMNNYQNKSVIKIAGMGLACLHKHTGQPHTQEVGYITYMAPEVHSGTQYDTRADIYSLGVILQELFQIDEKRDYNKNFRTSLLMNKYQNVKELYIKMTENQVERRSESCRQILDDKHLWTMNETEFNHKQEFKDFSDNCDEVYKNSYKFKLIKHLSEF